MEGVFCVEAIIRTLYDRNVLLIRNTGFAPSLMIGSAAATPKTIAF